jgi:magnesium-transporting ATPase (P-type)
MESWASLFLGSLNDSTLIILMLAAVVSIVLGMVVEKEKHGWIEGTTILMAVFLVAGVTATNDYNKELMFRKLEESAQADEVCSLVRCGKKIQVNPSALTVGEIVALQVHTLCTTSL